VKTFSGRLMGIIDVDSLKLVPGSLGLRHLGVRSAALYGSSAVPAAAKPPAMNACVTECGTALLIERSGQPCRDLRSFCSADSAVERWEHVRAMAAGLRLKTILRGCALGDARYFESGLDKTVVEAEVTKRAFRMLAAHSLSDTPGLPV
jgi:hypothetical protein